MDYFQNYKTNCYVSSVSISDWPEILFIQIYIFVLKKLSFMKGFRKCVLLVQGCPKRMRL